MTELTVGGLGVSLAIMAIVEALKQAFLPTRFAFLTSVVLGALAGVFAVLGTPDLPWLDGILLGIMSGGAASGAYSGAKAIKNGGGVPQPVRIQGATSERRNEQQLIRGREEQSPYQVQDPPGGAEAPAVDSNDYNESVLSAAYDSLSVRLASEFMDGTGRDYS